MTQSLFLSIRIGGEISSQFLLPGGSMGPRYALQL